MKKFMALALALCLCVCMSATAFAAEIDTSVQLVNTAVFTGTTPVNLTTTNDGIGGGGTTPTKLNVIVPTSLPKLLFE